MVSCTHVQSDGHALKHACKPQTQQHIHEYAQRCMIAPGLKSPFLSLLSLPFSDAIAEAESQSSLTADECFTPMMNMARSPFSLISFSLSFRLSSEGTITQKTRVSRTVQSSVGEKSNAQLRPSSKSKGGLQVFFFKMYSCSASDKVKEAIFSDHVHITDHLLFHFELLFSQRNRRKHLVSPAQLCWREACIQLGQRGQS